MNPGAVRVGRRRPMANPASAQAGMGWLEFAVVAVLVAVIAVALLSALLRMQALGEKTALEMTIMNMRTGLRYRIAELITAGRMQEIGKLADANPVEWLEHPPEGYLGVSGGANALKEIPPGSWYFDLLRRELVYKVNRGEGFFAQDGGDKFVRLRVVAAPGAVQGVRIEVTQPYDWR